MSVTVDERRSLLAERDFRRYFLSRSASAYLVLAVPAAAGCLVLFASPVRRLRTATP